MLDGYSLSSSDSAEGVLHQLRLRDASLPAEDVVPKTTKIVKDLLAVAEVGVRDASILTGNSLTLLQSIQGTVQRVMTSGDAGVLADICLSNVKLLQLMHQSYQQLEHQVKLLQDRKSSQSSEVVGGLQTLSSLQQQIGEMDSKLLLYYEHLQLTRRR